MQVRLLIVSACAALALVVQARADHHEENDSARSSSEARDSRAKAESKMNRADTGTRRGDPGMLPESVEEDRVRNAQYEQTIVGTVKQLDKDVVTIQSAPLSEPHKLSLTGETRFVRDGRSISREQLDEGDMVRASFVGEGDSGRASEIEVIQDAKQQSQAAKPQGGQGVRGAEGETGSAHGGRSGAR